MQRRVMARPLGEPAWVPPPERGWRGSARRSRGSARRWIGPLVLLVIAGTAVALLGGLPSAAQQPAGDASSPSPHPRATSAAPTRGSAAATSRGPVADGSAPSPASSPSAVPFPEPASPSPAATPAAPTPHPLPSRPPGAAPASADEFGLEQQVIEIGFPFAEDVEYRYRDNWLDRREGPPEHYNHVLGRRGGELVRAHDGTDIYIRAGTPVRAPVAGLVIDPAERWQPWQTERYGETVVIVSQEPPSQGYAVLLVHLDKAFVRPGDVLRRGEVVGVAGNSGNAEGGRVHLHFELRAPFKLEWFEAGETRYIDAFNPYHSLRAADPRPAD